MVQHTRYSFGPKIKHLAYQTSSAIATGKPRARGEEEHADCLGCLQADSHDNNEHHSGEVARGRGGLVAVHVHQRPNPRSC